MMITFKYNKLTLAIALITPLALSPLLAFSQETDSSQQSADNYEEVVVLGSRRADRSATDSPVPIDVISASDFANQGNTDLNSMLRSVVPSFNVSDNSIADAATLIRPANLRGLPSDSTLVLVNGKRRHRASVISFLGGGINDGAQGPDISVIPSIALKQVEVLRDGAAAQYGSDAIAGVMNFVLKDASEGGSIVASWGEFYEGDGDTPQIAANIGLPLTENGFINISAEYKTSDPTSRSIQQDGAQALIDAGNNAVKDPVQIWGSPEIKNDTKLFFNSEININDNHRVYSFGNWAEREVEGGFYYRNPIDRKGVFVNNDGDILVGDLASTDKDGTPVSNCPSVPLIDGLPSSDALEQVAANPNCWAFQLRHPGGFTPRFGGEIEDQSLAVGVAGELSTDLNYDISAYYGKNSADFFINNTVNASLGPNSPTNFKPGGYSQEEMSFNLDLSYPLPVSFLSSELNIAGGFEWRNEEFSIKAGDEASYLPGPLRFQGFSVGSNGFQGFNPKDAGAFDRSNIALYLDLEADVTDSFLLGLALRWEDFDDFGTTTNGKVSARWQISDSFALRSAYSTGFRAPTVGQSNVRSTTTNFGDKGELEEELIIPPDSPIGAYLGGVALDPEQSVNFSFGAIADIGGLNITADFFNIDVEDRIALTSAQSLNEDDRIALINAGIEEARTVTKARFFTNDFDTNTRGVDIVASYPLEDIHGGLTNLSLTYNRTKTTVEKSSSFINDTRIRQLEESLPNTRWTLTASHSRGSFYTVLRTSYYDEFFEAHADSGELPIEASSMIVLDAEVTYSYSDALSFTLGAQNFTDQYPDPNPYARELGAKYPVISPSGYNGGFYYLRMGYTF